MGKTPLADEIETTSEFILKKLRSFVQPPGRKGTWLKRLNDHQLAEVYHRLRARQNVYHVVQVAQKDWQVLPRSKPESLCRAMRAFREKALGLIEEYRQGHPQTKARTTQADKMKKRAERIQKRVDAMEELSWLIRTQKERLKIMLERESLAIPSKETNRTVAELREILDTYLCHAERAAEDHAGARELGHPL